MGCSVSAFNTASETAAAPASVLVSWQRRSPRAAAHSKALRSLTVSRVGIWIRIEVDVQLDLLGGGRWRGGAQGLHGGGREGGAGREVKEGGQGLLGGGRMG